MPLYDPKMIEGHFDLYGEKEWDRHRITPYGKVQFHIHQHYLQKYVKQGDRVIEIGAGPGTFTIEMAEIGASVGVVDISQVQLKLNETKVKEAGLEEAILWRKKLDILKLEGIERNTFDVALCYGGPFSYVMEYVNEAMQEVLRVTKPGGYILASVMSCIGTYRHYVDNLFEQVDQYDELNLEMFDELTKTGDVFGKLASRSTHQCHMFRWSEIDAILKEHPVELLDASSSNYLSTGFLYEEKLKEIMKDPQKWKMFLKWELDFSREPGALDGGTHLLFVVKKKA